MTLKTKIRNAIIPFCAIVLLVFGYFYLGATETAHVTGGIATGCCGFVAFLLAFKAKEYPLVIRIAGSSSFGLLVVCYILYLFYHVSPSNCYLPHHSLVSMLYDIGQGGTAVTCLMMFLERDC